MRHILDAFATISVSITDPAFLKRSVLLVWDAGYDHRSHLQIIVGFDLRENEYCKKRKISQDWTWLSWSSPSLLWDVSLECVHVPSCVRNMPCWGQSLYLPSLLQHWISCELHSLRLYMLPWWNAERALFNRWICWQRTRFCWFGKKTNHSTWNITLWQWGQFIVLLGFMVVTGMSHFLQFHVMGVMHSMNSRAIWTVCKSGQGRCRIQGHWIERQGDINSDMQGLQGTFHMTGLCSECHSSGVEIAISEDFGQTICEKCKD